MSNELGTHEVINVAAGTAAGPLHWELERYLKNSDFIDPLYGSPLTISTFLLK